jgi:poly(A) polymerase
MEPNHYSLKQLGVQYNLLNPFGVRIIKTLKANRYKAYFVGGCIRDLLVGKGPKDFDVVTNATPNQIKRNFSRAFIIGRRFRLVHVYQQKEFLEVVTFRGKETSPLLKGSKAKQRIRDNTFGDIHSDVLRRDLTINALYLDPIDGSIVDYVGGVNDIKNKRIRMIGIPSKRITEDPIRMLRALRFAAKLDFNIDQPILEAINKHKKMLYDASTDRIMIEFERFFCHGFAQKSWSRLNQHGFITFLFKQLSPQILEKNPHFKSIITTSLLDADDFYQQGCAPSIPLLLATWYWPHLKIHREHYKQQTTNKKSPAHYSPLQNHITSLINDMQHCLKIPAYMQQQITTILIDQFYFDDFKHRAYFRKRKHYGLSFHLMKIRSLAGLFPKPSYQKWYQWKDEQAHR